MMILFAAEELGSCAANLQFCEIISSPGLHIYLHAFSLCPTHTYTVIQNAHASSVRSGENKKGYTSDRRQDPTYICHRSTPCLFMDKIAYFCACLYAYPFS